MDCTPERCVSPCAVGILRLPAGYPVRLNPRARRRKAWLQDRARSSANLPAAGARTASSIAGGFFAISRSLTIDSMPEIRVIVSDLGKVLLPFDVERVWLGLNPHFALSHA